MKQLHHYTWMVVGTWIVALSFTLLQSPNQLASGGMPGTALVLGTFFDLSQAMVLLTLTILILVGCVYFLGMQSLVSSIIGSLLIPVFVFLTSEWPPLTTDPLLASIFGGFGVGIGLAFVFRAGGNTGGFTLIAQVLHKFKSVKHSTSLLFLDATVIIAGGLLFSPENALYALIGAFVTRKTMDMILLDKKGSKVAYIISSRDYEEHLAATVLHELDRGLTKITGAGGYTNYERVIMMTVLPKAKEQDLRTMVHTIDPDAFIILCEATDVYGQGFSPTVEPPLRKKLHTPQAV